MSTVIAKAEATRIRNVFWDTNLQIIFAVTLMAVMGASSVTPAFPQMAEALGMDSARIGLLITVFTFPGILLTPVLGILADRFGRKRILVPSLFLFGLAGGACAFVRDFQVLLALRFLQGMGAAALNSLNVTIIGDLYTGKRRAEAMGYNASILSIGSATYPAIGGALAMLGWNFPFVLPILALPVGMWALFSLRNPEPKGEQQKLSTYFLSIWQSIRNRQVAGLFVASMVTFIILYGPYLTYLPFFIGHKFGGSSLTTGLIMSMMPVTMGATSLQLGHLRKRFSQPTLIIAAFIFYGLGIALIPLAWNPLVLLVPVILIGVGHGINIPSIHTMLAELAPMEYRAAFVSINNGMVFRLGQTLGPMIALLFAAGGLSAIFWGSAGLLLVSVLLIKWLLGVGHQHQTYTPSGSGH